MVTYRITLDPDCAALYKKIAQNVGLDTEQVLADALYRLAGTLSIDALRKKTESEKKG